MFVDEGLKRHPEAAHSAEELAAFDWAGALSREKQRAPGGEWIYWLNQGGRGSGKTRIATEWARGQSQAMPGSTGLIVARTAADLRDYVVHGSSGLLAITPPWERIRHHPSESKISWGNGTVALLRSADEPDGVRGANAHWGVADELAAWRPKKGQHAWPLMKMAVRLRGPNEEPPRITIATTPRTNQTMRDVRADADTIVVMHSMLDNAANLAPEFVNAMVKTYGGTRLGRQEIYGEMLEDTVGALWSWAWFERAGARVEDAPILKRVVVGVDPAASVSDASDETGIVVAGLGQDGHGYVLEDLSGRHEVSEVVGRASAACERWQADAIVVEKNQGGYWLTDAFASRWRHAPIKLVSAKRGKELRAQPVALAYERGEVHHVGMLPELEGQMCTWVPDESSPDRVDALVYALTEAMLSRSHDLDAWAKATAGKSVGAARHHLASMDLG